VATALDNMRERLRRKDVTRDEYLRFSLLYVTLLCSHPDQHDDTTFRFAWIGIASDAYNSVIQDTVLEHRNGKSCEALLVLSTVVSILLRDKLVPSTQQRVSLKKIIPRLLFNREALHLEMSNSKQPPQQELPAWLPYIIKAEVCEVYAACDLICLSMHLLDDSDTSSCQRHLVHGCTMATSSLLYCLCPAREPSLFLKGCALYSVLTWYFVTASHEVQHLLSESKVVRAWLHFRSFHKTLHEHVMPYVRLLIESAISVHDLHGVVHGVVEIQHQIRKLCGVLDKHVIRIGLDVRTCKLFQKASAPCPELDFAAHGDVHMVSDRAEVLKVVEEWRHRTSVHWPWK
jgi:hypothetical protein